MKAFFLDRDGVINENHSINRPEEFNLLPGVGSAIKTLNDKGYKVFIVTNQGGVGLGYMKAHMLNQIHDVMKDRIAVEGGLITDIRACIHKPRAGCLCRKPRPGMMHDLIKKYSIEPADSYMVGDRDVDITAGQAAGLKTVFVGPNDVNGAYPDYQFDTLPEAVKMMEAEGLLD